MTQQVVYFLLALYREVATLYRSHNANLHPKPEVSVRLLGCGRGPRVWRDFSERK